MDLRSTAGEDTAFHQADAAVEVVRQDARDPGNHYNTDQESGHEAEERERHQVETDVHAEFGVFFSEGLLVEEQEDLLPLAGGGTAGE